MLIDKEQSFASYNLIKVSLSHSSFKMPAFDYEPKENLGLSIEIDIPQIEANKEFIVRVTLKATEEDQPNFLIEVAYNAKFKAIKNDDELDIDSFSRINAPAIIYPYIRQHVRALTLEAGFSSPIILPVLNFIKIEANRKLREKASK